MSFTVSNIRNDVRKQTIKMFDKPYNRVVLPINRDSFLRKEKFLPISAKGIQT